MDGIPHFMFKAAGREFPYVWKIFGRTRAVKHKSARTGKTYTTTTSKMHEMQRDTGMKDNRNEAIVNLKIRPA